jgi:integrase/recombinase XerD
LRLLKSLEENIREAGYQNGSISVYMRTLMALFNKAIEEGYCKQELYPFKSYKISKLKTKAFKRAISLSDIRAIEAVECIEKSKELDAKNYFLFSFYNRGINFMDMALLKWDNIKSNGSRFQYHRSKTGGLFDIELLEPVKMILNYYKANFPNTGGYIFPVLDDFHKSEPEKG